MNDTEKLIHDLRLLGKYSKLEPNWLVVAADKIEELSQRVEVVRCCECKECEIIYPIKAICEEPEPRSIIVICCKLLRNQPIFAVMGKGKKARCRGSENTGSNRIS